MYVQKDITIDLNGHTLTKSTGNYIFWLNGKITLKNGTIKMGKDGYALCIGDHSTIEDVNVIAGEDHIVFFIYNGKTNIDNIVCTFKNCKLNGELITDPKGTKYTIECPGGKYVVSD